MTDISTEDCIKIIEQFEPSEEAKQNKQILIDGKKHLKLIYIFFNYYFKMFLNFYDDTESFFLRKETFYYNFFL